MSAAALLLGACGATNADEPSEEAAAPEDIEEVTLTYVVPFSGDAPEVDGFFRFLENLEENAPWITAESRGGPESIPAFDQPEAINGGIVDMGTLPPPYLKPMVPLVAGTTMSPYTPAEEREVGVYEYWREALGGAGFHYVGDTMANVPTILWLNTAITSADLSGLQIRVSESTQPLVSDLGGGAVTMEAGDTYTAVERGVVDGVTWPAVGMSNFGWDEVVQYELSHYLYPSGAMMLVMNQGTWDGLDAETQQVIEDTMVQTEAEVESMYDELVQEERDQRLEAGVELLELPDGEVDRFREIVTESAWNDLERIDPDAIAELRELYGQ